MSNYPDGMNHKHLDGPTLEEEHYIDTCVGEYECDALLLKDFVEKVEELVSQTVFDTRRIKDKFNDVADYHIAALIEDLKGLIIEANEDSLDWAYEDYKNYQFYVKGE